jgi:hypothetical protein
VTKDGWGYTSKSEAATQQANSGYTNGIPTDLYNTYLQNKDAYAAAGKPPPLNFDHTVDGQVTVTPYADPSKAVSYAVPTGTQLFFNNVKGMPVIDKLTDLKGNTIVKANSDGTFNTDDVYNAFKSGTLSKTAAISLVGGTAFNQAQINAGIMTILNNPKNGLTDGKGNYDLAKALSQKNVTQTDLLEAGFTQDEINAALKPPKATTSNSNTPSFPSSYSQDNWDADIASGKIPKGATFVSYDSKTGIVNYTVPSTTMVPDAIYTEINKSLTNPKQTMSGQVSALNDAIENAGYWNNSLLGKTVYLGGQTFYVNAKGNILTQQDQVKIQWNNLTDTQKQTVAGLYSQDLYRTNPFSETTKQIAVAGQKGGIIGELATSPLTGITIPIAKAASGQHVTAQDVEGAVVTVVGDALMVGGGDALVSGFGNVGKVIVNSLLTGMGTVGMVDTVMQIKQGGTPGSTIAVEAALSAAALIGGAGGLVSQLVPKGTPDIDVAQQFIDKMKTQTTPEGLAKTSPFQASSGNLAEIGETPDTETAEQQAEVTASYKEWMEATTQYAQNEYDINDLTSKITENRTTLDAITKGTTIPDEYSAKLASDTEAMEKTLAKLKDANPELARAVGDTESQFTTTMKQYAKYLSENGMMRDDSGMNEAIKNLPHNSADIIKAHIDLLMNGDNNPTAIAAQEAEVNSLQNQLDSIKSTDYEDLKDIKNELAQEQRKLAMMKIGSLSQAHSELVNAREELADVKDIMENGKLNDATKTNLLKIQNQLESQIADRESLLKTQLIGGEGTKDIIKVEDIKDSQGDVVGKRIYSNEGVKRYDIDDDGNIMWETGRDESSGAGKSPNTPTETRPSPDTTTPEETELQQTSRGMPKGGAAIVSAIGKPALNIPAAKKLGEVSVPSTKTETTKVAPATTQAPVTTPNKQPSKTEVVSPLTETNPAINPSTVHSAAQSKSQQQIQQQQQAQQAAIQKAQNEAMDQNMDQSKNQNMQQNMNQQMQKAGATSTKVDTIIDTDTNPPPDNNDKTVPPGDISKPNITKDAEGFVHVPQGSATWKQGFGYRTLIPPYDQKHFIFTMKPPKDAVVVPNAKSAKDTIQKLGKGNLPQDMIVKMGIMTVDVKDPPNKPQKHSGSIAFKRIPVTNNAGSRSAPPHVARIGSGITRRSDR